MASPDIPTRIARVELRVSDVRVSAAFYARLVGLEATTVSDERAELRPPGLNGGGAACLILTKAERAGRAPMRAAGLFHTAFRFRDRAGLAAALKRCALEMQQPLTGASDHGVSEALYLDDPDGLGIELYRDRPQDEWPQPQGAERVHMFTAPLELEDLISADDELPAELASRGVDIGHVHLKVADVDAAARFWTGTMGMELMTKFGTDAAFLGQDGYHHHVGANAWASRGAPLEPEDGSGLNAVAVFADAGIEPATTPDGIAVAVERRAQAR